MKACSKCNKVKEFIDFYTSKEMKDGFRSQCKICHSDSIKAHRETPDGKNKYVEYNKKYVQTDSGKASASKRIKKWRERPRSKDILRRINKRYLQSLQGKTNHNFTGAKRRAAKLQATPPWLNDSHKSEIKNFYSLAQELQWLSERKLHVDHIVPLQGEKVCGLHVPWNLQILPETMNLKKHNKF